MGILDQITNMKRQGVPNEQIINELAQQGVSPNEILNALKQAEIKNAVTGGYSSDDEMQPSIMPRGEAPSHPRGQPQEEVYQPQQQQQEYIPETYAPQQAQEPQYYSNEPQQQYYSPETAGYAPQSGANADMMMEVADQVFSEKIKKIHKVVEATSEATILLQNKFENLSERIKKMENIIDKLYISILEKVGSYGSTLGEVKKEMSMMQDSFSKMISSPKHKEESEKKVSKKK
jgi:hypothetical protein